MGLPATGKTALYRNPLSEVVDFLNKYHKDQYKVYNLCTRAQDQYDPEKFGGNVVRGSRHRMPRARAQAPSLRGPALLIGCGRSAAPPHRPRARARAQASFPFADHGVPPLILVDTLAHSVKSWVEASPERIVCIHCLAGKGRTGLMVCAALLLLGVFTSAGEAPTALLLSPPSPAPPFFPVATGGEVAPPAAEGEGRPESPGVRGALPPAMLCYAMLCYAMLLPPLPSPFPAPRLPRPPPPQSPSSHTQARAPSPSSLGTSTPARSRTA